MIVSLCTGFGGLDQAVEAVFGGEVLLVADNDPGAAKLLAYRYPGITNVGDISTVDWYAVDWAGSPDSEDVILTAGFPCQDVSCAGSRAGLRAGTRTGVWSHVARAISDWRPTLVVLENVRGLLSAGADSDMEQCPWCLGDNGTEYALRAFGAVLGDLSDLGFDAEWQVVSAASVGAAHRRERVFILAWRTPFNPASPRLEGHSLGRVQPGVPGEGRELAADAGSQRRERGQASGSTGRHQAVRNQAGDNDSDSTGSSTANTRCGDGEQRIANSAWPLRRRQRLRLLDVGEVCGSGPPMGDLSPAASTMSD